MLKNYKIIKTKIYYVLDATFNNSFRKSNTYFEKYVPGILMNYILDCGCSFEDIEKALKADKCFWGFLKSRMKQTE